MKLVIILPVNLPKRADRNIKIGVTVTISEEDYFLFTAIDDGKRDCIGQIFNDITIEKVRSEERENYRRQAAALKRKMMLFHIHIV